MQNYKTLLFLGSQSICMTLMRTFAESMALCADLGSAMHAAIVTLVDIMAFSEVTIDYRVDGDGKDISRNAFEVFRIVKSLLNEAIDQSYPLVYSVDFPNFFSKTAAPPFPTPTSTSN